MSKLDIVTLPVTTKPEDGMRKAMVEPIIGQRGNLIFVGEGNISIHPQLIDSTNLAMFTGLDFRTSLLLGLIGRYRNLLENWAAANLSGEELASSMALLNKAWITFTDGISVSPRTNIHDEIVGNYYHRARNGEYAVSQGMHAEPDEFHSVAIKYLSGERLNLSVEEFDCLESLVSVLPTLCEGEDKLIVKGALESAESTDVLFGKITAPVKNSKQRLRQLMPLVFPNANLFAAYPALTDDISSINKQIANWYENRTVENTERLSGILAMHIGLIATSTLEAITLMKFYGDYLPTRADIPTVTHSEDFGGFNISMGHDEFGQIVDIIYEDNIWLFSTMEDLIIEAVNYLAPHGIRIHSHAPLDQRHFNPLYIEIRDRVIAVVEKALETGDIEVPNLFFESNQSENLGLLFWTQLVYGKLVEQVLKGRGKNFKTKNSYEIISNYARQITPSIVDKLSASKSGKEIVDIIVKRIKGITLETIFES